MAARDMKNAKGEMPTETYASGSSVEPASHTFTPEEEYQYWEDNYTTRDYINRELNYESSYGMAYRYGVQMFNEYDGRRFQDIDEGILKRGWEDFKQDSTLSWEEASEAVQDAYDRLHNRNTDISLV